MKLKSLLLITLPLVSVLAARSQIFQYPNPGNYGTGQHRFALDSTFYLPTGCGVPSGTAGLRSYGFTGFGQRLKQAAIYYDSCGHNFYVYDPSDSTWALTGSGSSYTADEVSLHLAANQFSIKSTYPGQASITTTGTIISGIWQSTAITDPYIASSANWNAKLTSALPSANIFVGNGSGVAAAVPMTGAGTISNTGAFSLSATGVAGTTCTNCNLTYNAAGQITVAANGSGGSGGNPFDDNIALVQSHADHSRQLLLSAASISPSTLRTWTFPDVNGTVARSDAAQTIAGTQTLSSAPIISPLTGYLYANGASAVTAATTIPNAGLTNMASNTLKGNNTGGLATPADLTVSQVMTMLSAVSNALGTSFLGYGPYASKPGSGTGLYFASDSIPTGCIFYDNAGVMTNLTPQVTLSVRGLGQPGDTTMITLSGSLLTGFNINVAAIRDSSGSCVKHAFNADGSMTIYSTCMISALATGDIFVGNGSGIAAPVSPLTIGTQLTAGQRVMTDPVTGNLAAQPEVIHSPADYAEEIPLPAYTVSGNILTASVNNALVINAITPSVSNRILVFLEPNAANNGIYTVTQVGSGSLPWILTRGTYSSIGANMEAMSIVGVKSGIFAGRVFRQMTTGAITIGTTPLVFSCLENFNIAAFGAIGDGKEVYDMATTNGSHNATSATAKFISSDAGKSIRIPGGFGTSDYLGTIASVTNSTTIVLSGAAPTATTSNDTARYGTDNTTAIQNCIYAVDASGYGGVIEVPIGWFMVAGALQTSVASTNPNSQFYIPAAGLLVAGQSNRKAFIFKGQGMPNQTIGIFADSIVPKRGSVIESLIEGTYSASTPPAMFSTRSATGFSGYNYSKIAFKDITFLVQPNRSGGGPTMSIINGYYMASLSVDDCVFSADESLGSSVTPTNKNVAVVLNSRSSEVDISINHSYVAQFYYGVVCADHAEVENTTIMACRKGLVPTINYDVIHADNVHILWCNDLIYIPATAILGGMVSAGSVYFKIDNLDAEIYRATGAWYDNVNCISDSGSFGHSTGFYTLAQSSVGLNGATQNLWNKYDPGSDSNFFYNVGKSLAGTVSAPGNTGDVLYNNASVISTPGSDALFYDAANKRLGIGAGSSPANAVEADNAIAGNLTMRVWNTNTSGGAVVIANGSSSGTQIIQYNPSHASYGAIPAGGGAWYTSSATGVMMVDNASGKLDFAVGSGAGPSAQGRMNSSGVFLWGTTTDNSTGKQQILNASGAQLALHYDATHYSAFTTNSAGSLAITGLTGLTINSGAIPIGSPFDSVLVENTASNVATIKKVIQSGQTIASNFQTAFTAAQPTFLIFTVPADGSYVVNSTATVNSVTSDVLIVHVSWTDENNASQTYTWFPQGTATGNITATGSYQFNPVDIRVKSGATITVFTTLTGAGSINYDLGGRITFISP